MKAIVNLRNPLTVKGVPTDRLMLREPEYGDVIDINTMELSGEKRTIEEISRVSGIGTDELKPLPEKDFKRLERTYDQLLIDTEKDNSLIELSPISIKIILRKPIELSGVPSEHLVMRIPEIGDWIGVKELIKDSSQWDLNLYARLTDTAPPDLRRLGLCDVGRVIRAYEKLIEKHKTAQQIKADDAALIKFCDFKLTVKLLKPITLNKILVDSIVLREPLIGDRLDVQDEDDENKRELALLARLADASPDEFRKLSVVDFRRLQRGYLLLCADDPGDAGLFMELAA